MELHPLPGVGVEVLGVSAAAVSALEPDSPTLRALAEALEEHDLLWFHAYADESPDLTPLQLRELYTKLHRLRYPQLTCVPPSETPLSASATNSDDSNLRGRCFPGYPETNVLGYAAEVADWHGLSGSLEPTAWWEKQHGQFHHDGGFSCVGANLTRIEQASGALTPRRSFVAQGTRAAAARAREHVLSRGASRATRQRRCRHHHPPTC